ncbi:hypothetical protein ACFYZJ_30160 [Streptomyces sp. NPDC001848]|uniref:hypothetical protein n=1 Tax=Streptomyces sp. NPDC001848 TaxID=3364618 RepID=UPI00367C2AA3
MTEEQAAALRETGVVLEYRLQHADMLEAIRLILRKRRSKFIFRLPFIISFGLLGVAVLALHLAHGRGVRFVDVLIPLYAVFLYFWPHIAARGSLKAVQHQGLVRATVDEAGVRMVGSQAESTSAWGNFGSYAESKRVFILRSPDRVGRCAMVLAKRGAADPADVDRLRTLLDQHLTRA